MNAAKKNARHYNRQKKQQYSPDSTLFQHCSLLKLNKKIDLFLTVIYFQIPILYDYNIVFLST